MIIIEIIIIFCFRLGSLFSLIGKKLFLKQDFKSNIDIDTIKKTKMIIIETLIFCCRLGSLFSLIEKKLLLKQDFKSNIDINTTTNEDDNCLVIIFSSEFNLNTCAQFWCASFHPQWECEFRSNLAQISSIFVSKPNVNRASTKAGQIILPRKISIHLDTSK